MRSIVFVVAAATLFAGCTPPHSRLKRVTLWHGDADCTACQAQAVTLWPAGPTSVTLTPDSVYTAQLELDVPGDPDRCIFQFVSGSWELPSHEFRCDFERSVMTRTLSTRRYSFPPNGDSLWIRVDVLSYSERKQIELLLDGQRHGVTWIQ